MLQRWFSLAVPRWALAPSMTTLDARCAALTPQQVLK